MLRAPHISGQGRPRLLSGFTLVEVLVALVITGMLASILMSSLFYMFKVQDSLRGESFDREQKLRGQAWFRAVLSHCLPLEKEEETAFKGSSKEIFCETTEAIVPASLPALTAARIFLVEQNQQIALKYQEAGDNRKEGLTLASWSKQEVKSARFRFVDAKGASLDGWPPDRPDYESLPRQIELSLNNEAKDTWLAAPKADPWLPEKAALPPGLEGMFK